MDRSKPLSVRRLEQKAAKQPSRSSAGPTALLSNLPPHFDFRAKIEHVAPSELCVTRQKLVANLAELVEGATRIAARIGAAVPILVRGNHIIAGREWLSAYCELGYEHVPIIRVDHLTENEVQALEVALGGLGQNVRFDEQALACRLESIFRVEPDLIRILPWSLPQIDQRMAAALLGDGRKQSVDPVASAPPAVSILGDCWQFSDGSRLLHGDSLAPDQVAKLFGDDKAQFVCTDPPYGTKIKGVVSRRHGEFVSGSNLTEDEILTLFLTFLRVMQPHLVDGCMVDTFIDHRSMYALMTALRETGLKQKSLCVWDKQVAGMGSPFRHVAEHIIVSKYGDKPHINNIELGKNGRNRSTIWRASGYAGFGGGRADALARHPTCKPIGLIADAILDFTHPGHIVFDPFIGSGTTLLAAQRVHRLCFGIEIDATFVDGAVKRLEQATGKPAHHRDTGLTYSQTAEQRTRQHRVRWRPAAQPTPAGREDA